MTSPSVLVTEFEQLFSPVPVPGGGLRESVQRLLDIATLAVPSMLGWSLSVSVDGCPVTLTSVTNWVDASSVRASLRVPFDGFLVEQLDGHLVLYAAAPYAFSHPARDLAAWGLSTCRLRTDQDLNPLLTSGLSGLHHLPTLSRAMGIMLQHGGTAQDDQVQRAA